MERSDPRLPRRLRRVSGGERAGPGLFARIVAGDASRRTRLHDERGRRAPLGRILRNLPPAFLSGTGRLAFGSLPPRPWISYDAQRVLAAFLNAKPRTVLEFGSGQSTRWYADRAKSLVSIENDRDWFVAVERQLAGMPNVDYRLATDRAAYAAPDIAWPFDLVMIDGAWREDCARFALEHITSGGLIYLDNSDKGAAPETGDIPAARASLIAQAERRGWAWQEFTDFAPAQFFVQRGLLIRAGQA